jgi:hypothetical protein
MNRPRDGTLFVTTILGAAFLGVYTLLSIIHGEGFAIPVGILSAVAGAVILRGPVGKALANRIEGRTPAEVAPPEEVLVELDDLRHRVVELEERLDFTERMLTQSRETAGLPRAASAGPGDSRIA